MQGRYQNATVEEGAIFETFKKLVLHEYRKNSGKMRFFCGPFIYFHTVERLTYVLYGTVLYWYIATQNVPVHKITL